MRFLLVVFSLFISLFAFELVVNASESLPKEIKVYSISYIPPSSTNPEYPDSTLYGPNFSSERIQDIKSGLLSADAFAANLFTEASRYKGYKNTSIPYLRYKVVSHKNYIEPMPMGLKFLNSTKRTPDFVSILERENVCDLVDNEGIKQFWIYVYVNDSLGPIESNMSMGKRSKKYWNYESYGDITQGEHYNNLPICNNTYVVFNFQSNTYRYRTPNGEPYTHFLEFTLGHLDKELFWGKFVGTENASAFGKVLVTPYGCGWTHYPPNGTNDYDWYNQNQVLSDCENWNPQRSGSKSGVSCTTWNDQACTHDDGKSYKLWWMQNLPGYNNGLYYDGKPLINWWDVVYDFDSVLANESGLTVPDKVRFDANKDGEFDVLDLTYLIQYIFSR